MVLIFIIFFSSASFAQDNKAIDNKGKIKQMRAKSVKKKEKASTKDIAGKRLRTKNTNSVAGRAVHTNPSPYANERRGKDRAAKPIGGQSTRIRSRSAESARNNVYPQRGPFVNQSSKKVEGTKSKYTRSSPRSRTSSAESSRSNVYPQKGPFVNQSSKQPERASSKNPASRRGRLSTNVRSTKNIRANAPRSSSSSAESSKGKRFQQTGAFVNRSSKNTEAGPSGSNRYTRKGKLSAGPTPPGKKRTVTPRSASQQFVTKGKKDVYWGKFSKGEKAITTDVSGNPLRRRNYRTPPNEIIKPKDPYAGRKRSSGDRAYSGTFRSGHASASRRTEKAWIGDLSGQPIRKRASKQTEVAGKRTTGPAKTGGSISATGKYRSNQPFRGGGGSISASAKYRSNKPYNGRQSTLSVSGKNRTNEFRPKGGGSISASGKYRSNQPFRSGGGSISASAEYRSNKSYNGRRSTLSVSGKNRVYEFKPKGGGSISASGKYRSNQPFRSGGGSISASAKYRSNKPYNGRQSTLSVSGQNRFYEFRPNGGGSISATGKYRTNKPFKGRMGPLSVSGENRTYDFKPKGGGSMSGKLWNNNNQPVNVRTPGIGASSMVNFQGNIKTRKPEKGGGSVSGKLWNNNGQPINVRIPAGAQAAEVGYSGKTKLPFFKRTYVRNPNAVEPALKKESPFKSMYLADGMQVGVKAKQTGTKPKAVKGSMPGLAPSKATVKASEYSNSVKLYWSYKHNPSSVDESQKTIAPSKNFIQASGYSGRTRLTKNYRHNPMSNKDALKVIAPGRAYARITDYQGNIKMSKYKDKRLLPDAKFAHSNQNNVKHERTMMTDFKLLWTKIFKKNGTQPDAVKEKSVRPRYDKRERELWPGLYD